MTKHVNGISENNYTCYYYNHESIKTLAQKHHKNALKLIHLNIESYQKNGACFLFLLKSLHVQFDIICLTETRQTSIGIIDKEFHDFHIYIDNPEREKGGAVILVRKNKFTDIKELDMDDSLNLKSKCQCTKCQIENKWISLNVGKQNIVIGCVYRHPKGDTSHFNDALNSLLNNISNNSIAIIAGDINMNLISNSNNVETYLDNLLTNNFIPCITLPTRITHHSATIIDHINIRTPKNLIQTKCSSGNLFADISDHLPNFLFLDVSCPNINDRPYVRLFTPNRIKHFQDNIINELPLIDSHNNHDVNHNYDIFSSNYYRLFNKYFPFIKISRKKFKDKPHITNGIKVSIKHRDKLFRKYHDNPNDINKMIWKKFRNKTNEIIKRAEQLYYSSKINKHNSNCRELWKTFGKILNKNKIKHNSIVTLSINNKIISNKKHIVEEFNKYFCQVGENLACKFNENSKDYVN